MPEIMLRVGDLRFSINGPSYEKFQHKIEAMWATQQRAHRRPALQSTGIGEETISLTGTVYGLFREMGTETLRPVEAAILNREPYLVMDGTGRDYGFFVIKSMDESREKPIDTGAPQQQLYTIELSRYGEDINTMDDSGWMDGGSSQNASVA